MERTLGQGANTRGGLAASLRALWPGAGMPLRDSSLPGVLLSALAGLVLGVVCLFSPVLAVVLTLGLVFLVTSLSRPVILCYLVISTTILMSEFARDRMFRIVAGNEITLVAAVAIAVVLILADKNRKIILPNYFWVAFCLLIGGTVLVPVAIFLLQGIQLTLDNAFKLFSQGRNFLVFLLFVALPTGAADRRKLVWWMLAFGVVVAVVGLAQAAHIGIVERLLSNWYASGQQTVAGEAGRVTSLLGAWNSLGIFMMTISLMGVAVLFEVDQPIARFLIVGAIAIVLLCLVASGSYAGVIGLGIGFVFMQLVSRRMGRSVPLIMTAIFVALPLVGFLYPFLQPLVEHRLTEQFSYGGWVPQTFVYRLMLWETIFIPAIRAHFPWPVYPTVPSYYAWQWEESQYILLLFRTGLPGFVSYLAWIGVTMRWLFVRFRDSLGVDRALALAALTLTMVLVIAGFTNEVFSFSGTIDYLWIMLALVANAKAAK